MMGGAFAEPQEKARQRPRTFFDEPFCVLAPHEHLERVAEREVGREGVGPSALGCPRDEGNNGATRPTDTSRRPGLTDVNG